MASSRSWLDRGLAWRDRLLASAGFRAWAGHFPLTRAVARRRSRALFDLCAGFVYSQVLAACVRLDLFDLLAAEGPRTPAELAEPLRLSEEATLRLLEAARSLDLVAARSVGRYGLGPLGAALVDNPGVRAMVLHHAMLYADLADPVALLRGERRGGADGGGDGCERAGGDGAGSTELARYWPYAAADMAADMPAERVAAYTELMSASQPLVTQEILAAYPFRRHRCLMDVGGGDGTFLEAVGRHVPGLRLVLVDLPAVARRAEARFAAAGLAGRAGAVGADFLNDPLPRGADIVSLVRVVHDHDDARVLRLLRAVRAALPPDGTLLIAEPMAGTPGAEPVGGAYFGFYLLAMGRGRARTPAELDALLRQAGFDRVRPLRTDNPLVTSLLVARPAAAPRNV